MFKNASIVPILVLESSGVLSATAGFSAATLENAVTLALPLFEQFNGRDPFVRNHGRLED